MDINKIRTFAKENKKVLLIGIGFIAYLFLLSYLGYDGLIAISVLGAFAIVYAYWWIKSKKMEKEQRERERIVAEQKEIDKKMAEEKKAAAINAFLASIDLEAEIDCIFSVIGNSPTWSVFEKGLANLIKKTTDTTAPLSSKLEPKDLFPAVRETLLKRIMNNGGKITLDDPATAVLADDLGTRLKNYLYLSIIIFVGGLPEDTDVTAGHLLRCKELFTDGFGFSFRAANHVLCSKSGHEYAPASDTVLLDLIDHENSPFRQFYESDPFTADEVKQGLIKDLRDAAYKTMSAQYNPDLIKDEKALDALCYLGCLSLTHRELENADDIADIIIYDAIQSYLEIMS